jgi:hypothetical protein
MEAVRDSIDHGAVEPVQTKWLDYLFCEARPQASVEHTFARN